MLLNIRSETEKRYKERLRSPEWDVGDGTAPRLQYVLLSLPRTGSEWLCASLRQRGIGVPMEYLTALDLAQRLGSGDQEGNIRVPTYFAQLHAARTTPNGVFGLKLHPLHLKALSSGDELRAAEALGRFDRIIVLRRRDRLLQAISLARALFTGQFHIVPGDTPCPLTEADGPLFREIATQLVSLLDDERYVDRVVARVDPLKVPTLWYEDLTDTAIDALAADLAPGGSAAPPHADHGLPRRGDAAEALGIKQRFLSYITGEAT
jgi:LPS sulfotransferase NodH